MKRNQKHIITSAKYFGSLFSGFWNKCWPLGLLIIFFPSKSDATAQLNTLVNLDAGNAYPQCTLIRDSSGNLFGTSNGGGANQLGSIFEVTPGADSAVVLGSFTGTNGYRPSPTLVDVSGNIYGASGNGGSTYVNSLTVGDGCVFEQPIGSANTITPVYSFSGLDGFGPDALVADARGDLFGTTSAGGSTFTAPYTGSAGFGTVFEISATTHTFRSITSFDNISAAWPAALTAGPNGILFGVTTTAGPLGYGTIFSLDPSSGIISTLAPLNYANGRNPNMGLAIDAKGDIFGTMQEGGEWGFGTVFELPAGTSAVETLYSFSGTGGPAFPRAAPVVDANGDIFGTTINGGDKNNDGTLYEIPEGTNNIETLVTFNFADGQSPYGLVSDEMGNLYGVTGGGGSLGFGTVYELTNSGFVVPEPSALLLVIGSAFFAGRRRRRNAIS
jgi:uncharacterized repeat protein (TIGR03803 family)